MLFADEIRSLREKKKLPQREIAAALSVDIPMYSRIERGERPIKREQIKVLADILNTDESELRKLWLADQVATLLKDDNELIDDVLNITKINMNREIQEFHLFAGIGGGIYGGYLLGHKCSGGVEIDTFCQDIIKQRQNDGWMNKFPIYGDITKLNGSDFKGSFDVLCGGFPCQAFSHAAHGKNIPSKNLWNEMLRFVKESDANIVFGENVTEKALNTAKSDLQNIGFIVYRCRLSCEEIGADHRRNRFWLLAVKNYNDTYKSLVESLHDMPKLFANVWTMSPNDINDSSSEGTRRKQLKAVGNAQSPFAAATAFRVLLNRHINHMASDPVIASDEEINAVFTKQETWIKKTYPEIKGLVHTPTTMANYCCDSMMKHQGCRNYKEIFGWPTTKDAEYLMGFPIGASSPEPQPLTNYNKWNKLK